jgi:hypothetical protein
MIKVSALENPNGDFILDVHVNLWIKTVKIWFKFNQMMAAGDIGLK